MKIVKYFRL